MKNRGSGSGGPEDVDAAFAEIIAGLEAEGVGRTLSRDEPPEESDGQDDEPRHDGPRSEGPSREGPGSDGPGSDATTTAGGSGWRSASTEFDPTWSALDDMDGPEGHYHPPEPPPLPKPRRATVLIMIFIGLGLLLLIAPSLLGLASTVATPIALLAITCGLGFLVLSRRHGGPPPGADSDGAQV